MKKVEKRREWVYDAKLLKVSILLQMLTQGRVLKFLKKEYTTVQLNK